LGVAFTSDQKKPSEDFSFQDNRTSIFFDPSRLTGGNASATAQSGSDGKCCECAGPNKDKLESKEKAHQYKIDFENFLHNKIYVKNPYESPSIYLIKLIFNIKYWLSLLGVWLQGRSVKLI